MFGRFAPSPTSDLHLGNLRTALVAWLAARASGRGFLIRIEDLDQQRVAAADGVAERQLADLASLGLDHDGEVVRQSQRLDHYQKAFERLDRYECFCTRREIAEAAQAPHQDGFRPYPGTCRDLTERQRAQRRRERSPAWRGRAGAAPVHVVDLLCGPVTMPVDDFVLRRGDGTFGYHLAVVVDDAAQGVDQVVRGDDLLSSTPRHVWLAQALGLEPVREYLHVPLAVNAKGVRLAKRDRAVSLAELTATGWRPSQVLAWLGASLGLCRPEEPVTPEQLLDRFDLSRLPRTPWVVTGSAHQPL